MLINKQKSFEIVWGLKKLVEGNMFKVVMGEIYGCAGKGVVSF